MSATRQHHGISFSFTVRVSYPNRAGYLAKITQCVSKAGGDIGAADMIGSDRERTTLDFTLQARIEDHVQSILDALRTIRKTPAGSYFGKMAYSNGPDGS